MKQLIIASVLLMGVKSYAANNCIAAMVGEAVKLTSPVYGDIQRSGTLRYEVEQSNRDESRFVVTILEFRNDRGAEGYIEVGINVLDFETCKLHAAIRE